MSVKDMLIHCKSDSVNRKNWLKTHQILYTISVYPNYLLYIMHTAFEFYTNFSFTSAKKMPVVPGTYDATMTDERIL